MHTRWQLSRYRCPKHSPRHGSRQYGADQPVYCNFDVDVSIIETQAGGVGEAQSYVAAMKATMMVCLNSILRATNVVEIDS